MLQTVLGGHTGRRAWRAPRAAEALGIENADKVGPESAPFSGVESGRTPYSRTTSVKAAFWGDRGKTGRPPVQLHLVRGAGTSLMDLTTGPP